ncbi:uncharacterized protein LOC109947036 [Prunus persica]|uniref:uncharacterized protein LOC109947036 n=1 Tax=Prunus persica TaxID=3760 RepID=UPI0009AB4730|nr:uncharacterized protein LOC109947036 [Prunus persica]
MTHIQKDSEQRKRKIPICLTKCQKPKHKTKADEIEIEIFFFFFLLVSVYAIHLLRPLPFPRILILRRRIKSLPFPKHGHSRRSPRIPCLREQPRNRRPRSLRRSRSQQEGEHLLFPVLSSLAISQLLLWVIIFLFLVFKTFSSMCSHPWQYHSCSSRFGFRWKSRRLESEKQKALI